MHHWYQFFNSPCDTYIVSIQQSFSLTDKWCKHGQVDTPRTITNRVCQSTNNVCCSRFQSRDNILSSVIAHNVDHPLLSSWLLDEQSVASYDAISKVPEWQAPLDFNSSSVEDDNMERGGRGCGLCKRRERREGKGGKEREGVS